MTRHEAIESKARVELAYRVSNYIEGKHFEACENANTGAWQAHAEANAVLKELNEDVAIWCENDFNDTMWKEISGRLDERTTKLNKSLEKAERWAGRAKEYADDAKKIWNNYETLMDAPSHNDPVIVERCKAKAEKAELAAEEAWKIRDAARVVIRKAERIATLRETK